MLIYNVCHGGEKLKRSIRIRFCFVNTATLHWLRSCVTASQITGNSTVQQLVRVTLKETSKRFITTPLLPHLHREPIIRKTFPRRDVIIGNKRTIHLVVYNDIMITLLQASKLHVHITLTSQWARWRLKSPASRLFTQLFIQVQIKENVKAPHHWTLCGEFTGDRWILRTKGQ